MQVFVTHGVKREKEVGIFAPVPHTLYESVEVFASMTDNHWLYVWL